MTTSGDDGRASSRRWLFVLAALWVSLGTWVLSSGEIWLGLAQLALGIASFVAALSPRIAAWDQAPLYRRK